MKTVESDIERVSEVIRRKCDENPLSMVTFYRAQYVDSQGKIGRNAFTTVRGSAKAP